MSPNQGSTTKLIIKKITYYKFVTTRHGIKIQRFKSPRRAEMALIEYDKPTSSGFTGAHYSINDALEFELGDYFIESNGGLIFHKQNNVVK